MADSLAKGAHFLDEDKAQAAHARVVEQYGLTEASGDRYWRLKSAIYRSMGGRFEKAVRDPTARQIRQGMPPLPDHPPVDPIARRIRHAVTHHVRGGVDLHKADGDVFDCYYRAAVSAFDPGRRIDRPGDPAPGVQVSTCTNCGRPMETARRGPGLDVYRCKACGSEVTLSAQPMAKAYGGPAGLAAAAFRRDPHPMGPPPARNRATFPYQGTLDFQGLKVRVENAAGSTRRGTSPDGTPWETHMRVHYGEFVATQGADGDAVDCFVGPGRFEPYAYVVHTQDPGTRRYDEDKVMLGFGNAAEATAVFRAHYTGRGFLQSVRRMSIGELRAWLADPQNRGRKINGGDVLAKADAFLARVRSGKF